MQKYKEINGNDYVKDSRTTINETMQSIQSMNSGTAFPTNNLFEGMKCYRTDLKKTYTLRDAENGTWVEDAHASLSDEATHAAAADTATKVNATVPYDKFGELVKAQMGGNDAFRIAVGGSANNGWVELATADDGAESIYVRQYADAKIDGFVTPTRTATLLYESGNTSFPGKVTAPNFIGSLNGNAATATKLQTPRTLSLTGKATGSATFDGSANAAINVTSVNADTASKLSTARKINITGNASGAATFDGTSDANINVSVSQAAHADKATQDTNGRAFTDTNAYMHISALADNTDFNNVKTTGIYYCTDGTYPNRPYGSWGILTVYSIGTVKQEYRPNNAAVYYTREYNNANWTAWSKVNAANADTATKLATPRAISLTGNASGSATFDGSGNVSINTTVNESKHAAAANNDGDGANIANTYLKRSGGTMTGPLNFANATWNLVGDDSYVGDHDISGTFCVKGANGETGIALVNEENESDYARISYGGGNINFNKKIGGNLAGTADNADTVDGIHAASMFYNKGDWGAYNWGTIGAYQVNNNPPVSDAYGWGQVISISTADARFQLYASDQNNNGRLRYRTGWGNNKDHPWNTILDSENYNLFAPTKTGGGASGTWGISITGNANTASTASSVAWSGVTGKPGTYPPSAHNHDSAYPSVTGARASGTWGINISGNADSATNADTVDGYHASDIINRISAANTGGIVAASLTENGYAKFANGLILQWGNMSSPVTFPIAFPTKAMNVVAILQNDDGSNMSKNRLYIQTLTTTGFTIQNPQGSYRYYAVGC